MIFGDLLERIRTKLRGRYLGRVSYFCFCQRTAIETLAEKVDYTQGRCSVVEGIAGKRRPRWFLEKHAEIGIDGCQKELVDGLLLKEYSSFARMSGY